MLSSSAWFDVGCQHRLSRADPDPRSSCGRQSDGCYHLTPHRALDAAIRESGEYLGCLSAWYVRHIHNMSRMTSYGDLDIVIVLALLLPGCPSLSSYRTSPRPTSLHDRQCRTQRRHQTPRVHAFASTRVHDTADDYSCKWDCRFKIRDISHAHVSRWKIVTR